MLKWGLLFLCIHVSFLAMSQVSVQQGNWCKHKNALTHQGFIFADSLFVYSIDYQAGNFLNGPKLLANQFDKKTSAFVQTVDLSPLKKEGLEQEVLQVFNLKNNFITVSTQKTKEGEKKLVLEKITTSGIRTKTVEFDFKLYDNNLNENIEIVTDKLEQNLIICNNIPPTSENDQLVTISSFNSDLNSNWTDTLKFPDRDKQFLFSHWSFDGTNKVFFVGKHISNIFQPDLAFSSLKENTQFLFQYDHKMGKTKEIELSLNKRFINKVKTELDSNRWIIAGTYSNDKTFKLDGVFSLILSLDLESTAHSIHDFTETEQQLFSAQSAIDKKKKFSDELLLKSLEITEKGEFALVAEEFRKEWQEPLESRMTANNFTELFYYQNILVFWFNKKGSVTRIMNVTKNQVSSNDKGRNSSFHVTNTGNKLLLFYNDNPKNRELAEVTSPLKSYSPNKKSYLNCVEINSGGSTIETIILPTSRRADVQPKRGTELIDGITYFLLEKRGKMALVLVDFIEK